MENHRRRASRTKDKGLGNALGVESMRFSIAVTIAVTFAFGAPLEGVVTFVAIDIAIDIANEDVLLLRESRNQAC